MIKIHYYDTLTKKQFNTYKEGLDLEFLREYCMEHGEVRTFFRGETLEDAGETAQWVAYVERGCFKYMVHNDKEGRDYCTGFAFEGEFVADFFAQVYTQYLDSYRMTTRERYKRLLSRCPEIVQSISLKDIASYLKVTPTTISNIRREITFSL